MIVPVYNVEKYIHQCVDSILNQTYRNLEVILVDDGSTDRSGEICDEYAKADSRVKVIHQKNAGVSAARNTGLDAVIGELIAFVDSDDYINVDNIERLFNSMGDAECVVCGSSRVDVNGELISEFFPDSDLDLSGKDVLNYYYGLSSDMYGLNCVSLCGKLYKRDVWRDLRFCAGMVLDDILLMPYILLRCKMVRFVSDTGYNYRITPNSITTCDSPDRRKKLYMDSFLVWEDHLNLYRNLGLSKYINAVEELKVDKIIAHSLSNKMPLGLELFSRRTLRRSVWFLLRQRIRILTKIRYLTFALFGKTVYKFVRKII